MNVVRTALYDGIRDQKLMPLAEVRPLTLRRPIATIGDAVVTIRRPRLSDWVDGVFVGDHPEPAA